MARGHAEGECAASECSLLCNDFLRLGFRRMLVDPGVRQVPPAVRCEEKGRCHSYQVHHFGSL